VTFTVFKEEKRKIHVNCLERSQDWQIAKLMKALEHATDSSNNRAALKRPGLTINPRVFPPVAVMESRQLIDMIDASTLPDGGEVDGSAGPFIATQLPRAARVFGSGM
jgi:hypothetical protein